MNSKVIWAIIILLVIFGIYVATKPVTPVVESPATEVTQPVAPEAAAPVAPEVPAQF